MNVRPCDECHSNPGMINQVMVVNGMSVQKALCPLCAQKYTGMQINTMMQNMQTMLAPFMGFPVPQQPMQPPKIPDIGAAPPDTTRCKECSLAFAQFQQHGMLGCTACYESFAHLMPRVLQVAQGGASRHHGKIPSRSSGRQHVHREIARLREQIEEAIKHERYEDAVELRDRIRALQDQLREGEP